MSLIKVLDKILILWYYRLWRFSLFLLLRNV